MDAKYMVILIILFVSALIIGLDTWNRIKLRRRVKQEWGKFPVSLALTKKKASKGLDGRKIFIPMIVRSMTLLGMT